MRPALQPAPFSRRSTRKAHPGQQTKSRSSTTPGPMVLGNAAAPPRPPCRDSLREVRMTARGSGDGDAGDPVGSSGPRTGRAGPGTHRSTRRLDPSTTALVAAGVHQPNPAVVQRPIPRQGLPCAASFTGEPSPGAHAHPGFPYTPGQGLGDARKGQPWTDPDLAEVPGSPWFRRVHPSGPVAALAQLLRPFASTDRCGWRPCGQFAEPTAGAPAQAGHTPVTPPVDHRERQADAAHPARTYRTRTRPDIRTTRAPFARSARQE